MKEYIVLISKNDPYTESVLKQVLDGTLKEIKFYGEEAKEPN